MFLQSLQLEHFRNHEHFQLEFEPKSNITYIVGENARGKTNILEAIYLLALTKSFRTGKQQNLIQWGREYARIRAKIMLEGNIGREFLMSRDGAPDQQGMTEDHWGSSGHQPLSLEIFLGNPPQPLKVLKRNGVKVSAPNFIGHCQVVFFHPEDLNMLYLGPELRRRYLDILNLQVNSNYYRALQAYRRILAQRNALLRLFREGGAQAQRTHAQDFEIWNEQLAVQGSLLIFERFRTVQFLHKKIQDYYRKISRADEKIDLHYRCNIFPAGATSTEMESTDIKATFRDKLNAALPRDIQAQVTTIGPHRDDIEFFLNDRPLEEHASRGEYRSLLLSLKLLELQFLEQCSGEKPILLLDDVFSELDLGRQKMLLEAIESHQTIITATHHHEGTFREGKMVSLGAEESA